MKSIAMFSEVALEKFNVACHSRESNLGTAWLLYSDGFH